MRTPLAIAVSLLAASAWAQQGPGPVPGLSVTGNSSQTTVTATGTTTAHTLADQFGVGPNTYQFGAGLNTVSGGIVTGPNNTAAYNAAIASVLATGGGIATIPGSYAGTFTWTTPDPSVGLVVQGPDINRLEMGFDTSGVAATDTGLVLYGYTGTTRPSNNNRAAVGIWSRSQGSGSNFASKADFALSIFQEKDNWSCTTARFNASLCSKIATQGENDSIAITGYNGGPDANGVPTAKTASAPMVVGENSMQGIGFSDILEALNTVFSDSAVSQTVAAQVDVKLGPIDSARGMAVPEAAMIGIGLAMVQNDGTIPPLSAIYISGGPNGGSTSGQWNTIFENIYGGNQNFTISDKGTISLGSPTSPSNQIVMSNTGALADVKASGKVTFSTNPSPGSTIVLNGQTWTFVSSVTGANQTLIGASLSATLTQLQADLNLAWANTSLNTAYYTNTSTVLTVTAIYVGAANNAYTLSAGTSGAVASGATLTGGSEANRTALGTLMITDGSGNENGAINKDGTISSVLGVADDNVPAWANGTAYILGDLVTNVTSFTVTNATYDTNTGIVTLTLSTTPTPAIAAGYAVTVSGITGSNVTPLNGNQSTAAITSGGTLTYNIGSGRSAVTYSSGGTVSFNAIYQDVAGTATGTVAPTVSAGNTTGADGITWVWRSNPSFSVAPNHYTAFDFSHDGQTRAIAPFYIGSTQQTQTYIPLMGIAGAPSAANSVNVQGGMVLRNNGGPGRTEYLNEGVSTYNPVMTASGVGVTIAAAGTNLATATGLTTYENWVGSGTGGVRLAGTTFPAPQIITNLDVVSINVYPPSATAAIDSGLVGVPVVLVANTIITIQCYTSILCLTVH